METLRARWTDFTRDESWPVIPLLLVQFLTGAWTLSQGSFFAIYLNERLAYTAVAVATMVSAGQVSGMLSGFLGGLLSDRLGSRGLLIAGVFTMAVASLVFQVRFPPAIALLWFLSGLGMGLITLGGSSYLTRVADPRPDLTWEYEDGQGREQLKISRGLRLVVWTPLLCELVQPGPIEV